MCSPTLSSDYLSISPSPLPLYPIPLLTHTSLSPPVSISSPPTLLLPLSLFYTGTNIATKDEVAIKLESVKTKHPQLHIEAKFYKIMQSGGIYSTILHSSMYM